MDDINHPFERMPIALYDTIRTQILWDFLAEPMSDDIDYDVKFDIIRSIYDIDPALINGFVYEKEEIMSVLYGNDWDSDHVMEACGCYSTEQARCLLLDFVNSPSGYDDRESCEMTVSLFTSTSPMIRGFKFHENQFHDIIFSDVFDFGPIDSLLEEYRVTTI